MVVKANKFGKNLKLELDYIMSMFQRIFGVERAEFFNLLLTSEQELSEEQLIFLKRVQGYLKGYNITFHDILQNKDLFMEKSLREQEGSFFTPLRWSRLAHEWVLEHLDEDLSEWSVWDSACGSGNLLYDLPECKHKFASTLNPEDIPIVNERIKGVEAFQMDFLSSFDGFFSDDFTTSLPENLQKVIYGDEKLLIIINPPYSTAGTSTVVGQYLQKQGMRDTRIDLYRQFIWQVCNLVQHHDLTNVEFVLMVPSSLHTAKTPLEALNMITDTFNFRRGFIYPASEFEGVSNDFNWGISTTFWSRAGGVEHVKADVLNMEIWKSLDEMEDIYSRVDGSFMRKDRKLEYMETTAYPMKFQMDMVDWCMELAPEYDAMYANVDTYGRKLLREEKLRGSSKADFYLSQKRSLRDVFQYIGMKSSPMYNDDIPVTEDNWKRACAMLAYCFKPKTWEGRAYQRMLKPIENDFYLDEYLPNAIIMSICNRRNMSLTTRALMTSEGELNLHNATFYLTKEEILESIELRDLLEDVQANYKENTYILKGVSEALEKASPEMVELYNVQKEIFKKYLREREVIEGDPLSRAYNLSFAQVRQLRNYSEEDEAKFSEVYIKACDKMDELCMKLSFDFEGKE